MNKTLIKSIIVIFFAAPLGVIKTEGLRQRIVDRYTLPPIFELNTRQIVKDVACCAALCGTYGVQLYANCNGVLDPLFCTMAHSMATGPYKLELCMHTIANQHSMTQACIETGLVCACQLGCLNCLRDCFKRRQ